MLHWLLRTKGGRPQRAAREDDARIVLEKDVPRPIPVAIDCKLTRRASKDLIPTQFLVNAAALPTCLRGVLLCDDVHSAPCIGLRLRQQPLLEAVVRPCKACSAPPSCCGCAVCCAAPCSTSRTSAAGYRRNEDTAISLADGAGPA